MCRKELYSHLSLIYIDDLVTTIPRSLGVPRFIIWLFADDIAVSSGVSGIAGYEILQEGLDHIAAWCDTWLALLSLPKCIILIFDSPHCRLSPPPPFTINNIPLAVKDSFNYLGLIYTNNLKWHKHFAHVRSRINYKLHLISRVLSDNTPAFAIRTLITSLITPTFTYGMPFWRPTQKQCLQLQSLLIAPLRRSLHLPHSAHHLSILTECGMLDYRFVWGRSVLLWIESLNHLEISHPSVTVFANHPTHLSWHRRLASTVKEWNIGTLSKPFAIHTAASSMHMSLWRNSNKCKDLIQLRKSQTLLPATYIRYDTPLHSRLRARLRLNRSNLSNSLFRRHLSLSPACSTCNTIETPDHLLICPLYHDARQTLIRAIGHLPSINTILGEPPLNRSRKHQRHILLHTGQFLHTASTIHPNGF